MASIVLHCPNCQQPYQMSPEQIAKYSGRTITCRRCKQPFAFDAAMDAAAHAAGQDDPVAEEQSEARTGFAAATHEAPPASAAGGHEEQGAHSEAASYVAPAESQPPPPRPRPARAATPVAAPSFPPPATAPPFPPSPAPASTVSPVPPYSPQDYVPPSAPVGYSPGAKPPGLGDIFSFQRMALPAVLPLVFWVGIAWCLFNGLRLLLSFVIVYGYESSFAYARGGTYAPHIHFDGIAQRVFSLNGVSTLIEVLFWVVLGPLFWRGFCELILAASRLQDTSRR